MRMVTMMAIMNYNRPIWSKLNLVMMLRLINLLQKQHRKKRFDIKGMLEGRKKKWICWRSDSLSIKQANGEQRKKKKLMGRGERCQLCGLRDKLDISKRTWKKNTLKHFKMLSIFKEIDFSWSGSHAYHGRLHGLATIFSNALHSKIHDLVSLSSRRFSFCLPLSISSLPLPCCPHIPVICPSYFLLYTKQKKCKRVKNAQN